MKNPTLSAAVSLAKTEGDIVTQTLDALNSPSWSSGTKKSGCSSQAAMSDAYDLSKSILGAAYEAKGAVLNKKN